MLRVADIVRLACCASLCGAAPGQASEFRNAPLPPAPDDLSQCLPLRIVYVAPDGCDTNTGLARAQAFRTIGRAAAQAEPGDLVLVAGGVYRESISLTRAGAADHPIVFRAMPDETPVITWGAPVDNWRAVPDRPGVYRAALAEAPMYVWENSTISIYKEVADAASVARLAGTYAYDQAAGEIHLHTLDRRDAGAADIVAIQRLVPPQGKTWHWYREKICGFGLLAPYNRVEGFCFAYVPVGAAFSGAQAQNCAVRNCTAYGGIGGIAAFNGCSNTISGNVCFRNQSHGILAEGSSLRQTSYLRILNNILADNANVGIFEIENLGGHPYDFAIYGLVRDPEFSGNLVIKKRLTGHGLIRYKSGAGNRRTCHNLLVNAHPKIQANAAVQFNGMSEYLNNTVIGGSLQGYPYPHETGVPALTGKYQTAISDNLYLPHAGLAAAGFANPHRHDYRLTGGSPHLGRGAFPNPAPILYVAPDGDNACDGRAPERALAGIGAALRRAAPGATIYVMPGTYRENPTVKCRAQPAAPLAIRSYRPESDVILEGSLTIAESAHIIVEDLTMLNLPRGNAPAAVSIAGSEHVTLRGNILAGFHAGLDLRQSGPVLILNNTLRDCRTIYSAADMRGKIVFRHNIFQNSAPPAPDAAGRDLISERNFFIGPGADALCRAWRQAGIYEPHPTAAMIAAELDETFRPAGHPALGFAGLRHEPAGARRIKPAQSPLALQDFQAAATLPHAAVIAWETPGDFPDCRIQILAGTQPAAEQTIAQNPRVKQQSFACVFRDLRPDTGYTARLRLFYPLDDKPPLERELRFRTPASHRPPATVYVAPDGDDHHAGFDRGRPLQTLAAATLRSVPGDTILVAPGIYRETLRIWYGGIDAAHPLTIRAAVPNQSVIDSDYLRENVFTADRVDHVVLDGFNFRGYWYAWGYMGGIIRQCRDFTLANCVFEPGAVPGWSCLLVGIIDSSRVNVTNNLFVKFGIGITADRSDNIVIDHNTFYRGGWFAVSMTRLPPDGGPRICNNIFDSATNPGKKNPAIQVSSWPAGSVCDYNLFWRKASPGMRLFGIQNLPQKTDERAYTIEELQSNFRLGRHSILAEPRYADPDNFDFSLRDDSPGANAAEDGGNLGWTPPGAGYR